MAKKNKVDLSKLSNGAYAVEADGSLTKLKRYAVVEDGTIKYFKNGLLDRDDGPAIVFLRGEYSYHHRGKLHREDGPAVKRTTGLDNKGFYSYYLFGKRYETYAQYKEALKKLHLKRKLQKNPKLKVML